MNSLDQSSSTKSSPNAAADQRVSSGRPIGVLLLTLLCLLTVVGIVVFVGLALLGAQQANVGVATVLADLALPIALIPIFAVIGVGLWRLRRWGLYLAVGFLVIAVAAIVIDSLTRYTSSTGWRLALNRGIIPAVLIFYLLHPSIRAAFRQR